MWYCVVMSQTSYFRAPPLKKCVYGGTRIEVSACQSICLSACLPVRPSVCSFFLSALDLCNYSTNFVQTSQVDSIYRKDVHSIHVHKDVHGIHVRKDVHSIHVLCSWFIEFTLSFRPLMKFVQVTPG